MSTFCYERPNGEIFEEVFPMGEAPPMLFRDGYHCKRNLGAEMAGQIAIVKGTDNPVKSRPKRAWPMAPCVASGVHPSQAQELRDHLADRDCKTEVTPGGDPIYTSAAHRKKALKIRGMHDKASF